MRQRGVGKGDAQFGHPAHAAACRRVSLPCHGRAAPAANCHWRAAELPGAPDELSWQTSLVPTCCSFPATSSRRAAAIQPGACRGLVLITLFSSSRAFLMSLISASAAGVGKQGGVGARWRGAVGEWPRLTSAAAADCDSLWGPATCAADVPRATCAARSPWGRTRLERDALQVCEVALGVHHRLPAHAVTNLQRGEAQEVSSRAAAIGSGDSLPADADNAGGKARSSAWREGNRHSSRWHAKQDHSASPHSTLPLCPPTLSSFSCTTVLRPAPMAVRSVVAPPMGVASPEASMAEAVAWLAAAEASSESGTGVNRSRCFCFLIV